MIKSVVLPVVMAVVCTACQDVSHNDTLHFEKKCPPVGDAQFMKDAKRLSRMTDYDLCATIQFTSMVNDQYASAVALEAAWMRDLDTKTDECRRGYQYGKVMAQKALKVVKD